MNEPRWYLLRRFFRPDERVEVDDEIAFHIQMRTAELIEQGVDPERARALAETRFGPVPLEDLVATVLFRYWPPRRFGRIARRPA